MEIFESVGHSSDALRQIMSLPTEHLVRTSVLMKPSIKMDPIEVKVDIEVYEDNIWETNLQFYKQKFIEKFIEKQEHGPDIAGITLLCMGKQCTDLDITLGELIRDRLHPVKHIVAIDFVVE